MTPSVITGPIAADPTPGTPEWERDKRAYDIEVARLAKYRQYEARLAQEIPEAELRVRVLAQRLGLPSANGARRQAPRGQTRARILQALRDGPAPCREIAQRAGVPRDVTDATLRHLRAAGVATKEDVRGGHWRLTDETPEGG